MSEPLPTRSPMASRAEALPAPSGANGAALPPRMAPLATPPPQAPKRRPFQGWGTATANGLGVFGRAVARLSVLVFGHIRARSELAYAGFQRHAKHTRYRAYALGSYALIAAGTLLFQLYDHNPISAYVRVEKVEFPRNASAVLIRNDGKKPWNNMKVVLNGTWLYERPRLEAGDHVVVRVDRFALVDGSGKLTFPPPSTSARHLRIVSAEGQFESDLE